jgi:hypothetical protein
MREKVCRKFSQQRHVAFRDDEEVALFKGADVEEGNDMVIFVDF